MAPKPLSSLLNYVTRFGRLTVMEDSPPLIDKRGKSLRRARCWCDCGTVVDVYLGSLRSGATQSCGCLQREEMGNRARRHGHVAQGKWSREYQCWAGIIQRCTNPNVKAFPSYGGRGITVCDRWRESFKAFYADMGPKPTSTHSIDRIDNNGNYEPGNCRWSEKREQMRNLRKNRIITWRGQDLCLADAARAAGIPLSTLQNRLNRGMSVDEAMNKRPRI